MIDDLQREADRADRALAWVTAWTWTLCITTVVVAALVIGGVV